MATSSPAPTVPPSSAKAASPRSSGTSAAGQRRATVRAVSALAGVPRKGSGAPTQRATSGASGTVTSATSGKSVAERSSADKELDSALAPVLALGQSYPQLNSSNNFLNLQENLADTENKLAFARQYYNDAVATLNRAISTLPWILVAPVSGVSEREYYQVPR